MTAQISDTFIYRGEKFALAGIDGNGLFDPTAHGLQPVGNCSACWRGHVVGYLIENGRLLVDSLGVYLTDPRSDSFDRSHPTPAPQLNGVTAVLLPERERIFYEYMYQNLGLDIPFTGGMLLAKDFIEDLYVHMGFHPAWKYGTVHELTFDRGSLIDEADVSRRVAKARLDILSRDDHPDGNDSRADMMEWIARCFSRDYRL